MDELLMAAATALVGKGTEALTAGGIKALESLRERVKARFSRRPALTGALERAEAEPNDEARLRSLVDALRMAAAEDGEFSAALAELVPRIAVHVENQRAEISLQTGAVSGGGTSVQNGFGIVHGNVTIVQPGSGSD